MISDKKVLGIIPARGGSKGVPRKNIRLLGRKPLIAWTIETAQKSHYIDDLILSSDDAEIIDVAKAWSCQVPFVRPPELATDTTPGIDPVLHALGQMPSYDYAVLLQPTSPLRNTEDIDACIETCVAANAPACVSLVQMDKSPYWTYTLDAERHMSPVLPPDSSVVRRQDSKVTYALNGAVYVAKVDFLKQFRSFVTSDTVGYVMPKERSIDIDTEWDMHLAELVLRSFTE